jgi:hypothetical protein
LGQLGPAPDVLDYHEAVDWRAYHQLVGVGQGPALLDARFLEDKLGQPDLGVLHGLDVFSLG